MDYNTRARLYVRQYRRVHDHRREIWRSIVENFNVQPPLAKYKQLRQDKYPEILPEYLRAFNAATRECKRLEAEWPQEADHESN